MHPWEPEWLAKVPCVCHYGSMHLSDYVGRLQEQLSVAAAAAGDDAREMAARLTAPLAASTRLVLLEALSAAADEITRDLAPGAVEVRLRAGEPEFVVTPPPTDDEFRGHTDEPGVDGRRFEEGAPARLNLRLPEALKQRIEEAAGIEGLSLNAWLVRAATSALTSASRVPRRTMSGGASFTGWVR